ncbi:MAG: hypothetical protein PSY14_08705 [bacterium]|nr:hypothetical protein [bacterium]
MTAKLPPAGERAFLTESSKLIRDIFYIWIFCVCLYIINQILVHGAGALIVYSFLMIVIWIVVVSTAWTILCALIVVISLRLAKSRKLFLGLSILAVFVQFYTVTHVNHSGNVNTQFGWLYTEDHNLTLVGLMSNLLQPLPFLAVYAFYLLNQKKAAT